MVKHTKKHMIGVIMDGIRDTDMIAGYAEAAEAEGEHQHAVWFAQRAKERLTELKRDWKDVASVLHLREHEDGIGEALACHIDKDIERIGARVEAM